MALGAEFAGGAATTGGAEVSPPPPPQATQNAVKLNTQRSLANAFMLVVQVWRQLGDLGVLRGVIHGFSEEARTRGFPSPSFDGFGSIVICCNSFIRLAAGQVLFVNIIRLDQATGNVRFGSQADLLTDITPTAASGGKADTRQRDFEKPRLNVCFHPKRPFKTLESH